MGSLTSPKSARHHISPLMVCGFAYTPGYMLTPGQPPPGLSYPPASPHHLPTTTSDPNRPPTRPPKEPARAWKVSISRFNMDACQRVREYQPVIHRLRLTASP